MKEVLINNQPLISTWAKAGLTTPHRVHLHIGITHEEGENLATSAILPTPDVIGRTLELGEAVYTYSFEDYLDEWANALRAQEINTRRSTSQKGKKMSTEARQKMSEAKIGKVSPFKGRTMSEESRKKISNAKKGKPSSMKGKFHTQETKDKMSEAKKRKWATRKLTENLEFTLE